MKTEVSKIRKNIMGTTSFNMKIKGMRKEQDFIVYPIQSGDAAKYITIQSGTRFGKIQLETGKGLMSKSHSNGAYSHHLQMDVLTPFELDAIDLQALKMHIFVSAGSSVGGIAVKCDNSNAIKVF